MDEQMHHFLLAFDHARNELVHQLDFGTDVDRATDAYIQLEREYQNNLSMDIVLVGSDSIETVKVTHSTYFPQRTQREEVQRILSLGR